MGLRIIGLTSYVLVGSRVLFRVETVVFAVATVLGEAFRGRNG